MRATKATRAERDAAERRAEVCRFMDDELHVYRRGEELWVDLRSLCKAFEQSLKTHMNALKKQPWARTTKVLVRNNQGHLEAHTLLDLSAMNGWLFSLYPEELDEPLRPKLVAYQRQCGEAIASRFLGPRMGVGVEQLSAALTQVMRTTVTQAIGRMAVRVAALERRDVGTAPTAEAPSEVGAAVEPNAFAAHQADERERILSALEACNWNRAQAAETLGIPRRTFYRRLDRYGIQESRSSGPRRHPLRSAPA